MKKILAFAILACLAPWVLAEGDPNAGKALAATCLACHGETGNSLAPAFPHMAGQHEQYLLKQMKDMQTGARPVPTMAGLLDNLSGQDLADLAAYYAGQERSYGMAKPELVELGESIYRAGIPRKKNCCLFGMSLPCRKWQWPCDFSGTGRSVA